MDIKTKCIYAVLQEYERNCLHQACSRTSGAVEIVKALIKATGKDAKLIPDNVSSSLLIYMNRCFQYFRNMHN